MTGPVTLSGFTSNCRSIASSTARSTAAKPVFARLESNSRRDILWGPTTHVSSKEDSVPGIAYRESCKPGYANCSKNLVKSIISFFVMGAFASAFLNSIAACADTG